MSVDNDDISYEENIKLHRIKRHEKLLRQSATVFANNGLTKLSMDKVAKEMGVTKVVLYRYFSSKDGLINTILQDLVDQLTLSDSSNIKWGYRLLTQNLQIIRDNQDAFLMMMRYARYDDNFNHHYLTLCKKLEKNTMNRLLVSSNLEDNNPIDVAFFAERLIGFLFDSINSWVNSHSSENDEAFVRWLLKSVFGLFKIWGETS